MKRDLLLRLPVEEVQALAQSGQIGDEEVLEYTGVKHLEQGGNFLDLDIDQAEVLSNLGHLTPEQRDKWLDFHESPTKFYAKDIGYGVVHGAVEAVDEVNKRTGALMEWMFPTEMTPEQQLDVVDVDTPMPAVPLFAMKQGVNAPKPDTFAGGMVSGITQFSAGFVPFLGPANKVMQMGRLAQFSKVAPKFSKFIAGQIASLGATATVTDLWEDRLSNLIADTLDPEKEQSAIDFDTPMFSVPTSTWLDPIANFLKAGKEDSGAVAVLKAVLEDQLLGAFAESGMEIAKGLFHSLNIGKAQLAVKHADNPAAIETEVNEVASRIAERMNITNSEYHPLNRTWETNEHTSGIKTLVKRRVNDPDRWLYVVEEDGSLPVKETVTEARPEVPVAQPVKDAAEHDEFILLLDIANDDAVKKKFSVPRVTKKQIDESVSDLDQLFDSPTGGLNAAELAEKLGLEKGVEDSPWKSNVLDAVADEVGASREEVESALKWADDLGVPLKPDKFFQINPDKLEARLREAYSKRNLQTAPPKPEVSPNGEKRFIGYITSDQGQLVPIAKGSTPEEVTRRLNMIKTNSSTATLYTRPLEAEGYTFDSFKKAVSGDQTVIDILSDTNVYQVESSRLAPGETTGNVQMAELKPLPEVKMEQHDAHVAAKETAQVERAVEAQTGLSLRDAQVPKTSDEAVDLLMQDRAYRKQVAEAQRAAEDAGLPFDDKGTLKATLQITDEELPEMTATILQLAKGMLDVDAVADFKLLMDEGYPIAGLTGKESIQNAGVNLLKIMSPENSKQIITHLYQTLKTRIAAAGGGGRVRMVVTDEKAVERLAGWTGVNDAYASLRELKAATDDLPVAMRAAEIYFAAYAELLGKYAARAVTMEDKLTVQEMTRTFSEVLSILKGAKANVGRALNIQKMNKGGDRYGFHLLDPDTIKDLYSNVGNNADKLTEQIAALANNPKAVAQFVRKYHGIRWVDGIVELKLSSMLSAPTTWAKNLFGTTARMVHEEFNMDTALLLQGIQNQDADMFKEIWRRWTSQTYALFDAFGAVKSVTNMANALKTGEGLGEAVAKGWRGFAEGNFWQTLKSGVNVLDPVPKWEFGGAIPNFKWLPLGDIIRFSFHVLSATDEVLQSVSYMGAMRANAITEGLDKGLSGKDLVKHAASLIDSPSREFHRRALHDSRWMVFKSNLEGKQKSFHNWLSEVGGSNPITKVVFPLGRTVFIPFDKVLFNILNSVGDTLPIFTKKFKADWAEGGIKRKAAVLRVATGCSMFYMGAQLYYDGKLRGATAYRDKATAQALHMPDNAYFDESTGEWKTLTGLDPAAMYFTIGANVAHLMDVVGHMDPETENKVGTAVLHGLGVLSEAVAYAPGMEGAHDLLRIIFDPGGSNTAGRMVVSQAGTLTPWGGMQKFVSNITQDPEYRDLGNAFLDWNNVMNGLWNQYWNREGMLPRRHVLFGERTENFEGYTVWGGQKRQMYTDPALLEITDLHMALDRMNDTLTLEGVTKKLDPEQMDRAQQHLSELEAIPGVKGLRGALNYVVDTAGYQALKRPEDRQNVLRNVISKYRSAAKKMVLAEDPKLQSALQAKLQQRMSEQLGLLAIPEEYGSLTHNMQRYLQGQQEDREE